MLSETLTKERFFFSGTGEMVYQRGVLVPFSGDISAPRLISGSSQYPVTPVPAEWTSSDL